MIKSNSCQRRRVLGGMLTGAAALASASARALAPGNHGPTIDAWACLERDSDYRLHHIDGHLPDRIFDAHAHLYSQHNWPVRQVPGYLVNTPIDVGLDEYRRRMEDLHPGGRVRGGLFFGYAFGGDRAANNHFVATEVARAKNSPFVARSHMLIAPGMEDDYIRQELHRYAFVGFKPYHVMADIKGPTENAFIEDFLPERHVRIAHEEKLTITLHLVRQQVLADPANQATIRRYCETYPDIRLIIAHSGGLNPLHTVEGVRKLAGIRNIWFDTGAICEPAGIEAILDVFDHSRLIYGTDFWATHIRGRFVGVGESEALVSSGMRELSPLQPDESVLAGLEALTTMIEVIRRMKLTDGQVEDIFYGNAQKLWP